MTQSVSKQGHLQPHGHLKARLLSRQLLNGLFIIGKLSLSGRIALFSCDTRVFDRNLSNKVIPLIEREQFTSQVLVNETNNWLLTIYKEKTVRQRFVQLVSKTAWWQFPFWTGRLTLTQLALIYRKRLEPSFHLIMIVLIPRWWQRITNGKHFSTLKFRIEIFDSFQDVCLSWKFSDQAV